MDIWGQVKSVIQAGGGTTFVAAAASFAAVMVQRSYPNEFDGLPPWAMPLVKLVLILTATAFTASAILHALTLVRRCITFGHSAMNSLMGPWLIKRKIRKLGLDELCMLLHAKSLQSRSVRANADSFSALRLSEAGIWERSPWDGSPDQAARFDILPEPWKALLTMDECHLSDPTGYKYAYEQMKPGPIPDSFLALLPKAHPAVHAVITARKTRP